ncbi:MAG TPA: hypothetical protein VGR49_02080 [Actinomycetota bacterium]|jgi:hypothetical protein|nr:hypothetical protein [Actinomycetota bacterium]
MGNGVARQYWTEILDVRLPVPGPEDTRRAKQRQKLIRRVTGTTIPKPPAR